MKVLSAFLAVFSVIGARKRDLAAILAATAYWAEVALPAPRIAIPAHQIATLAWSMEVAQGASTMAGATALDQTMVPSAPMTVGEAEGESFIEIEPCFFLFFFLSIRRLMCPFPCLSPLTDAPP